MSEIQKNKQLRTLICQGVCPICSSIDVRYIEHKKGQLFQFKCCQCHWNCLYTSEEFQQASGNWLADEISRSRILS